jgi:hypothetical protein
VGIACVYCTYVHHDCSAGVCDGIFGGQIGKTLNAKPNFIPVGGKKPPGCS